PLAFARIARRCRMGEGGEHAFHQLASRCVVDRLGHRAERDPSDFNRARNAKWSYFSRANRVRLYTMTKWTLPLWVRQKFSSFCSSVRSTVFALSPSSLNRSTTSYPSRRQYSSQARSCVGRLRFSVCSFVLTRT